ALPYPAGLAVLPGPNGDRLLIANNLSDNVVLLDVTSGQIEKSFALRRKKFDHERFIPSEYPYTVIANKAGTKAWVSLWNEFAVAELNLETAMVARWIDLRKTGPSAVAPGPRPTAMPLRPNETVLYVALSNTSYVAAVDLGEGKVSRSY